MILAKHGPYGWHEKIFVLQKRANWIAEQLDDLEIRYYRHPGSNIITLAAEALNPEIAERYGLVPDNHQHPAWYKIVVMDHVTIEKAIPLIEELRELALMQV